MSASGDPDELPRGNAPDIPSSSPHKIRWALGRAEWFATEWPAVLVWGGLAGGLAIPLAIGVRHSLWWLALVPVWLVVSGSKAVGIAWFLMRGAEHLELTVESNGVMLLSSNGSAPVYVCWVAIVNQGDSFLVWGGDGRYRLVIPKRVLTQRDLHEIAVRVGVDLARLPLGAEARVRSVRR